MPAIDAPTTAWTQLAAAGEAALIQLGTLTPVWIVLAAAPPVGPVPDAASIHYLLDADTPGIDTGDFAPLGLATYARPASESAATLRVGVHP